MDLKQQAMKKTVLAGLVMFLAFAAGAQTFRKGEDVEINKNLSDEGVVTWVMGNIIDIDHNKKQYAVSSTDKKLYNIPFVKEDRWIRRPLQPLTTSLKMKDESTGCLPSFELLKQKIREEFETDFSEYDSVIITYNNIDALTSYKNTDNNFGRPDTDVFPFNVDFTVRLVTTNSEGVQRKINWQFKRKYLLHQNQRGKCSLSVSEKEENLLSHI